MTDERVTRPLAHDMPLNKAVPSKSLYLTKEDCDPAILVQISGMASDQVEVDNDKKIVTVLEFHGDVKPLILKATTRELLKVLCGGDTVKDVIDKKIVLYVDSTIMYQGKLHGGIRMRADAPQLAQAAPSAAIATVQPSDDFDDEIPW